MKSLKMAVAAVPGGQRPGGVRQRVVDPREAYLKAIDKEIKATVNESAEFSKESPEPPVEELWTDIYA